MSGEVRPHLASDGVPMCDDACPSYDGKRCRVLGFRPGNICEPSVADMVSEIARLRSQVEDLGRQLAEARALGAARRQDIAELSAALAPACRERDEARAESAQLRSEVEAAHRSWQSDVRRLNHERVTACRIADERTAERDEARRFLKAEQEAVNRQAERFNEVHKQLGITYPGYCDDNVWGGGVVEMVKALQAERDALRGRVEAAEAERNEAQHREKYWRGMCDRLGLDNARMRPVVDAAVAEREAAEPLLRFEGSWTEAHAAWQRYCAAVAAYRASTQAEPVSKESDSE